MPNWAITDYKFFSKNEHSLKTFLNNLREWTSKSYVKNGFGDSWLGNIYYGSGIEQDSELDEKMGVKNFKAADLRFRGEISLGDSAIKYDSERNIYYFYAITKTAWVAMPGIFFAVLKSKGYDDINFDFIEDEEGCERHYYYCWNKEDVPDEQSYAMQAMYYESDDNSEKSTIRNKIVEGINNAGCYIVTQKQLKKILSNVFEDNESNLDVLLEKVKEYNDYDNCVFFINIEKVNYLSGNDIYDFL